LAAARARASNVAESGEHLVPERVLDPYQRAHDLPARRLELAADDAPEHVHGAGEVRDRLLSGYPLDRALHHGDGAMDAVHLRLPRPLLRRARALAR
jgi:hypothetical protein